MVALVFISSDKLAGKFCNSLILRPILPAILKDNEQKTYQSNSTSNPERKWIREFIRAILPATLKDNE